MLAHLKLIPDFTTPSFICKKLSIFPVSNLFISSFDHVLKCLQDTDAFRVDLMNFLRILSVKA